MGLLDFLIEVFKSYCYILIGFSMALIGVFGFVILAFIGGGKWWLLAFVFLIFGIVGGFIGEYGRKLNTERRHEKSEY